MKPSLTLPTLLCQAHNPHRKVFLPCILLTKAWDRGQSTNLKNISQTSTGYQGLYWVPGIDTGIQGQRTHGFCLQRPFNLV